MFLIIQDFWATCACPENFRCIEYIFYYSGVLSNLRLAWKQSCPGIFHCIEYTFYIQNFLVTCACPEKQRVPWIYCIECIFFIIQDFWATCACPEKRSCPGIFHCTEIYFIIQDFWGTCGCPENRVCPEIFQAWGGGRPPASYAYGCTGGEIQQRCTQIFVLRRVITALSCVFKHVTNFFPEQVHFQCNKVKWRLTCTRKYTLPFDWKKTRQKQLGVFLLTFALAFR